MKFLNRYSQSFLLATLVTSSVFPGASRADDVKDFGLQMEERLKDQSTRYFGVQKPLEDSAPPTVGPYRTPTQTADAQVALAKGLKATYLTRSAGNNTDMMAFFPAAQPTHLITCVEEDRITLSNGELNPSVQRVNLTTGAVTTILRGMDGCDGIRTTPWGTILATEETDDGAAYEILDPLTTTEQDVTNRATGAVTDSTHIVKRTALPTMAWEGLHILPSGVVIAGDELRPGTGGADRDGGALFKFVPTTPRTGTAPITNLTNSPLAAGSVFALQVSCVNNTQQFGQGCEIGNGAWVAVTAANARTDARTNGATGYYRPEDLHGDPTFTGTGVRFCWTNTGNEGAANYAEVVCGVDANPLVASATQRTVVVNRFVEGDEDFNSFDNLDFQPKTGILYVIEDHPNGDIFACLRDGLDRDIKTDGCVKVLSVKDSSAEPTGFIFSADGTTAYVAIQHSDDANMPLVENYPTDDVLKITGFKRSDAKDK
ncbi:MAG: DUF839 domain-containing protein [Deltaproteobacteria bacterium]|nr:DUF839 domain-containing protein [Deltaproteobacteria bacterium]